jgi:hypothetical protein
VLLADLAASSRGCARRRGAEALEELHEQAGETVLLGWFERVCEQLVQRRAVTGHRGVHPSRALSGERGEGTAAIVCAGFAADEPRGAEPIHGSRQTARRQHRQGGQISHPELSTVRLREAKEHVKALLGQAVIALDRRHGRSAKRRCHLEYEAGEDDGISIRRRRLIAGHRLESLALLLLAQEIIALLASGRGTHYAAQPCCAGT